MTDRILRRLVSDESGYTLIELLLVIVILSILLLIAVPAYLQYEDTASESAAKADARQLATAAAVYGQENATFAAMSIARLKVYDQGLSSVMYVNNSGADAAGVTARVALDASHFCVYAHVGRWFAYQLDPAGLLTTTATAAAVCI